MGHMLLDILKTITCGIDVQLDIVCWMAYKLGVLTGGCEFGLQSIVHFTCIR